MDYETFGEHQWMDTGIFDFLRTLPKIVFKESDFSFSTPGEIADNLQPVAAVNVIHPISWADEERDLTAWLGNELQEDAFNKLYALTDKVNRCDDVKIRKDWKYLQASDHFYYMSTKFFSDGEVHAYFNPYDSPYDAYINYMNILSDFTIRLNAAIPESEDVLNLANMKNLLEEKDKLLEKYENEIKKLKTKKTLKKPTLKKGAALKPAAPGKKTSGNPVKTKTKAVRKK